jgi:type I restriction enzyme S subunit
MPYGVNLKDTYSISEADYLKINQRSIVEPYDILISMIGTVGNISYIMYDNINFAIKNVGLFKTSSRRDLSEFILLYLKSDFITNHISSRLAGSTQKYISLTELRNFPFILPDDKTLVAFKALMEPLFIQINYNEIQSVILSSIRDTLLPKLMSGEIRVPLEEVV